MKKETGGWAFPVPNDANCNGEEGMTLRDYFASKAMQGIMAADWELNTGNRIGEVANHAYALADAMLVERAK